MAVEIVKAKPQAPSKFLIIGEPFSGKTTLAAQAPAPLFISTDGNAAKSGLDAVNVKSTQDVKEAIMLAIQSPEYKTIVLDTMEGIADLFAKEIISIANESGQYLASVGTIESLTDVPYGKLTGQLNQKLQSFAEALARVDKNVVILSYTKRQVDEVTGSIILVSELKNIRYITRFMDAQVLTAYDGEKYKANVISKREIMAGEVNLGEIEPFLTAIGWTLPKKSTKLGRVPAKR